MSIFKKNCAIVLQGLIDKNDKEREQVNIYVVRKADRGKKST
jgi:hypothetical protein